VEAPHAFFVHVHIEATMEGTVGIVVMKFGGTSVGDTDAIEQVIRIISQATAEGTPLAVVVSAMSGTTDTLVRTVEAARTGDRWGYLSRNRDIRTRHEEVVHQFIPPGERRNAILREIDALMAQHITWCDAVNILRESTPRITDATVALGERLSSRVIAAALQEHGVNARQFDAGAFLLTDDRYQEAEPDFTQTNQRIEEKLQPLILDGVVPIITGFLAAAPDGSTTTLGRGGSDYSAAIFAAALNAARLVIWTDVDGVMTTDPRVDARAQVLPYISYEEVGELAYYGARVLHPKTVQPIIERGIPMEVRNTFHLEHPGTRIGAEKLRSDKVIKAVTAIRDVSMLMVSGRGMLGVPGIAGRTFLATSRVGANILMISQSSSEQSFCFTVVDGMAQGVKDAVEAELAGEIARRNVDEVRVLKDVVIVTVVGSGMRGTHGVAGRVFSRLGEHEINVISIAQGGSECSISLIVEEAALENAVSCLHDLALESVAS
jgi:bifunctional aspartokinase / homoserine dehydrogenase 1